MTGTDAADDPNGPMIVGVIGYLALAATLFVVMPEPGEDFASYRNAMRAVADGHALYDFAALEAYGNPNLDRPVHPFIYPPSFLAFGASLLLLPDVYRWLGFFALNVAGALVCYVVWFRSACRLGPSAGWALTGAFLLSAWGLANLVQGQVNWMVAAVAFTGIALGRHDGWRGLAGGILVGIGAALKVSPLVLVAWWLIRRRWQPAAAALATVVLAHLAVLPWVTPAEMLHYWTVGLPDLGRGQVPNLIVPLAAYGNAGPAPWLHRNLPPATADLVHALWRTGLPIAALWAASRPAKTALQCVAQPVLLLAVVALTPAYVFEHHLILFVPLFALVFHAWWTRQIHRAWGPVVLLAGGLAMVPMSMFGGVEAPGWVVALCALDDLSLYGLVIAGFVLAVGSRS